MAFFQVLAVDLDGTLAPGGELSPEALAAIDEARRDGLVVVLVSGRIGAELTAEFPRSPTTSTRWCSKTGQSP